MTMAAVLTVTVSLGLVGAALYLKQGAAQASASWERQTQIQVWMKPSATQSEISYVRQKLYTSPVRDGLLVLVAPAGLPRGEDAPSGPGVVHPQAARRRRPRSAARPSSRASPRSS